MKKHRYAIEIRDWLKKAREDLKVASIILSEKGPAWATCFHCQQAAEKSLKALLLYKLMSYPKDHDLRKLAKLLLGTGVNIVKLDKTIKTLGQYYVETRYPGLDQYEVTQQQACEAVELARKVLDFVEKKIL